MEADVAPSQVVGKKEDHVWHIVSAIDRETGAPNQTHSKQEEEHVSGNKQSDNELSFHRSHLPHTNSTIRADKKLAVSDNGNSYKCSISQNSRSMHMRK